MEKLQLSEIAAAVGSATPLEAAVNDICMDTRKLEPGCLFLALRGANFDGHQFVKKAIADGAVAAVTISQLKAVRVSLCRIPERHCCKLQHTTGRSSRRFWLA